MFLFMSIFAVRQLVDIRKGDLPHIQLPQKLGKFLLLVFGLIIRHWARRGKPTHRKVAKVGVWECEVLLVVRHATGLLAT